MKRSAVIFSMMILLAAIPPCLPILAQPTQVPHEYPPMEKHSLGAPVSLLNFFNNVTILTAEREYLEAETLLHEILDATIPPELEGIINMYTDLSGRLATTLNNLEALYYEVSTLFSQDQFDDARQKLGSAEKTTINAHVLVEDLKIATETLRSKLVAFIPFSSSEILHSYEIQLQSLDRVHQLIEELDQLRRSVGLAPLMEITTKFYYPTFLEVSEVGNVYPGIPFNVQGQVISSNSEVERMVKVFLDDSQVAQEAIQGQFNLRIIPPLHTSTGRHFLILEVAPQGHYTSCSKSIVINLMVIPIRAQTQVPFLAIMREDIRISGKVYHDLNPIKDAKVSVVFGDSTSKLGTSDDGSFTTTIKALDAPFLLGLQELIITIEPIEPQYASLKIHRSILPINLTNTGVMLVVFVLLGLLVFNRVRTRGPSPDEESVIPKTELQELPAIGPPRSKYESTGIRGRILSAYLYSLSVVEKVITVPMMPHTTLREYVDIASTLLPTVIKLFTELTTMAENALYSSHKVDENMATKAEQLASTIKEELHNGVT